MLGPAAWQISFLLFSSPLLPPDLPQGLREGCLLLQSISNPASFPHLEYFMHRPLFLPRSLPIHPLHPRSSCGSCGSWSLQGLAQLRGCPCPAPWASASSHSTTGNTRWEILGGAVRGGTPKNGDMEHRGDKVTGLCTGALQWGIKGWEMGKAWLQMLWDGSEKRRRGRCWNLKCRGHSEL